MRVKVTSIHVDDPAAAFDFYTSVLGFTEALVVPDSYLYIVRAPDEADRLGLMLEPSDNPVTRSYKDGLFSSEIPAMVLGVDDVRAEYERLRGLGVTFHGEPETTEWGTAVLLEDGQGNLLQLHQDD